MKDAVLLELAARWERDATALECEDGSPAAVFGNAEAHGRRQGLRECADALRMLVQLLGGKEPPEPMLVGKRAVAGARPLVAATALMTPNDQVEGRR